MNLPELLVGLTTHYNALIRSAASQLHITTSQTFHLISIPQDGIPMSKLAHRLGLDASTLTRNIQKLEKLRLVDRVHDFYDKRVQKVILTKQGLDITEEIEDILHQMNNSIIEQIDLDTQENMCELLEKLVWSMDCIREK